MIGAIAIAGEGAPSHDTTAAIASNPGRSRTKSVPSSGIVMSGSTSCVREMVLTRPPWVAVSQSGGSTCPCSAQKNTDAPTRPVINAGTGSHHGGARSRPGSVRRQRKTAATATTTMNGSTVSGSNGMCTSCIAMPMTPMNPADSPGDIASRAHQCQRGLSSVASAKPGSRAAITTPGNVCARSWSAKPDRAQRPLSVATAKTVRAMIRRSSATDCRLT